ncbi:MAG TPA: protein kinase [Gemmataceae bacterium]|jgi:WD40 repeat protein/serine/threonine protein kinase|nr:protein kinase [Gemmataceae bacterium]
MESKTDNTELRERQLQEILLRYADAREAGQTPDAKEFIARHVEFAAELEEYFAGLRQLDEVAAPLRELVQPAVARQLGDFRLLRELGRGGMGIVYEAEQISLDRRVALKVLPFAAMLDSKQLLRFKNEAQAAAHLHHEHIVPVYAVGSERGVHYFAMQFIDGQSLDTLLRDLRRREGLHTQDQRSEVSDQRSEKVPTTSNVGARSTPATTSAHAFLSTEPAPGDADYFRLVARLGIQAAAALEHAHEQGIIHRDVKPANLLVDNRGHLWITDFGLARCQTDLGLTISGDLVGTLRYMSPEQALARSGTVDHRSDIYSLGATLYELLTLQPAFAGQDRHELLRQITFEEPRPPSRLRKNIPADLETVVLKAMAKEADSRYATARELGEDLQRFLSDRPVLAKRPTLVHRLRKWLARHKAMTAGAMILLLLTTVGLAAATLLIWQKEEETRRALDDSRTSEHLAEDQRELAQKRERLAHRYLYAADLNLAYQAGKDRQPARALRLLERHRPAAGNEDLRGFEWYHLLSVCGRGQAMILRGHGGSVVTVALSPDGKRLVSGGEDGGAWLWDTTSGLGHVIAGANQAKVKAVAFAADGQTVAVARESGALILWDSTKDREQARLDKAPQGPRSLAFFRDGKRLAVNFNGGVQLWDTTSAKLLAILRESGYEVYSTAVSPDEQTIAVGDNKGKVRLWKSPFGARPPTILGGHQAYVLGLSFSKDGRRLASAADDGTVMLWDLATGHGSAAENVHTGSAHGVAFSPDGAHLLSCGEDGSVQIWSIGTHERLVRGYADEMHALSLSADGRILATGHNDGTIGLWRVDEMQAGEELLRHGNPVNCIAFSRDNQTLASAGAERRDQNAIVKLWDASTPSRKRQTSLRETGRLEASKASLHGLCFSPDGRLLAAAGVAGSIHLWEAETRRLVKVLPGHVGVVWCAAFSPDSQVLATAGYADKLIKLWKVSTGECLGDLRGHLESVWSVAFSPDGRTLASGSRDGTARIWDLADFQSSIIPTQHKGWVWAVQFAPDGQTLATASQDRTVALWDTHTWRQRGKPLQGHTTFVRALAFFPDGKTLATGSDDRTVKLWDLETGQERATLLGHTHTISSLAVSSDGRLLISGSWDGTVRLWRAPEERRDGAPMHEQIDGIDAP